jgi:hypothetical protein
MPIKLREQNGDKITVLDVSGTLEKADYQQHFAAHFDQLVKEHGKLRVLFDMTDFHGWNAGAMWEELKFDSTHATDMERIAAVGDKKWEEGMMKFCKPFTTAAVKYFDRAEIEAAREWLNA